MVSNTQPRHIANRPEEKGGGTKKKPEQEFAQSMDVTKRQEAAGALI